MSMSKLASYLERLGGLVAQHIGQMTLVVLAILVLMYLYYTFFDGSRAQLQKDRQILEGLTAQSHINYNPNITYIYWTGGYDSTL